MRKLVAIDVQRAAAWKEEDRKNILDVVNESPGGASAVNKLVKHHMRDWIAQTAKDALDEFPPEERGSSKLLLNVANLLRVQGNYDEAEALYREALDADKVQRALRRTASNTFTSTGERRQKNLEMNVRDEVSLSKPLVTNLAYVLVGDCVRGRNTFQLRLAASVTSPKLKGESEAASPPRTPTNARPN